MASEVRFTRLHTVSTGDAELKKVVAGLKDLNRTAKDSQANFAALTAVLGGFAAGSFLGIRIADVVGIADAMFLLKSRIALFTGGTEAAAGVMTQLFEISARTKTSIEATATAYSRIMVSTTRLGATTDQLLRLTEALSHSFILSGSTGGEAAGAMVQFSQALSFGTLRGQELRSVLSGNAIAAKIFGDIAAKAGMDVFKFAEAGRFTSDVIFNAMLDQLPILTEMAKKMGLTFEQSMTMAMNELSKSIAKINEEFNINGKFATMITFLIDNKEATVSSILAIAAALAVLSGSVIWKIMATVIAGISLVTLAWAALAAAVVGGAVLIATNWEKSMLWIDHITNILKALGLAFLDLVNSFLYIPLGIIVGFDVMDAHIDKLRASLKSVSEEIDSFSSTGMRSIGRGQFPVLEDMGGDSSGRLKTPAKILSLKEQIGALNVQFNLGKIGAQEYNDKLNNLETKQLRIQLLAGELSIEKFNETLRKNRMEDWARLLDEGTISISTFEEKARTFKVEELHKKFNQAKSSVGELNSELAKLHTGGLLDLSSYYVGLRAGMTSFVESTGSAASQIESISKQAFEGFSSTFQDALKKGQYDFSAFTQSILDDIGKMIIKMLILRPIAQGLDAGMVDFFNWAGASPLTGSAGAGASPGAQYPVAMKAGSSLGDSATPLYNSSSYQTSATKTSEYAPSNVAVNIVNNSGAEITTQESTGSDGMRQIEVLIASKVKQGFASGAFDRDMSQSYGIRRKGF